MPGLISIVLNILNKIKISMSRRDYPPAGGSITVGETIIQIKLFQSFGEINGHEKAHQCHEETIRQLADQ